MPAERPTPKNRVERLLEGAKKKPSESLHISEFRKVYAGRQKSLVIVLRKEELDGNLPEGLEIPDDGLRVAFKRGSSVAVQSTSWSVVTYGHDKKYGDMRVLAVCSKTGVIENSDGSGSRNTRKAKWPYFPHHS